MPRIKWLRTLTFLALLCTRCSPSLTSSNSQDYLSNGSYYLTSTTDVRIYYLDTGLGTFVTQLVPSAGMLSLPKNLQSGDYESRTDNVTPRPLDLVAKVYVPSHPSGDFYFEAPVLGPTFTVTNVTTALSWYLNTEYQGLPIRLSQKTFEDLTLNIELICTDCREKSNTDVLNMILSTSTITDQIAANVKSENPTLDLSTAGWRTPPQELAYTSPILTDHGKATKTVNENSTSTFRAIYVDPMNSKLRVLPASWTHITPATTLTGAAGDYNYNFTYDDSGLHHMMPVFAAPTPNDSISFDVTVDDVNRPPTCPSPLLLHVRSNVLNSISLSDYCSDPDIDNTSLSYSLISGPYGLTLNSSGVITWLPADNGTSYSANVTFTVTDSKNGVATSTVTLAITPDNLPVFTDVQASYGFSEGSPSTFVVHAQDADGDPLTLRISPVSSIYTGFPDGAGSLNQITRTGSAGNYTFTVTFTPSYWQTVGADGTAQVRFALTYDSASGQYDSTTEHDPHTVTYNITNIDDPPQWQVQPIDLTATEGVDFGGVAIGQALDPSPNPTALTYTIENNGSDHCAWASSLTVTVDGSGNAFLWGVPAYYTDEVCTFLVRATDGHQLYSMSAPFNVTTTNVNQAITLVASPLTSVGGFEGKSLVIPLDQMFDDPDLDTTPTDGREFLTYDCEVDLDGDGIYESTCAAGGLPINFNPGALIANFLPPAQSAGTYPIRLTVTDVGGVSVTNDFDLIIQPYATAMTLATSFNLSTTDAVTVNEGSTYSLTLTATAASGRAIDNYGFYVNTPSCTVQSGSGACSASLLKSPGNLTGSGTTTFNFTMKPTYSDGDALFPASSKTYVVSFYAQKTDDATVYMQHTITITVNNTDRPPDGIEVTKGSFGCTGSSDNTGTDEFTICIDASQDRKVGNSWNKIYSIPMNPSDPDGANDSYSFSLVDALAPGSFNQYNWPFKLPNCVNASTGTILRTYTVTLSDGRGGTVTRPIKLKIVKASASSSCM